MPIETAPVTPGSEPFDERTAARQPRPAGTTASEAPARSLAAGVEVRTHSAPGSLRLVTDIVDAATRAVLYRIPPQAVTDDVVRQSELISRYERLMASTYAPARRRTGA